MTLNIMRWSLFFLIATGRGKMLLELPSAVAEILMNWIYEISQSAPFAIKTTEAPSYRRVALNGMRQELASNDYQKKALYHSFGIRDGNGIVFVSNIGEVYPSGFSLWPQATFARTVFLICIVMHHYSAVCGLRRNSRASADTANIGKSAVDYGRVRSLIVEMRSIAIPSAHSNRRISRWRIPPIYLPT